MTPADFSSQIRRGDCWHWSGGGSSFDVVCCGIRGARNIAWYLRTGETGKKLRNTCGDVWCIKPAHQEIA